jgi:hypothetical protein
MYNMLLTGFISGFRSRGGKHVLLAAHITLRTLLFAGTNFSEISKLQKKSLIIVPAKITFGGKIFAYLEKKI